MLKEFLDKARKFGSRIVILVLLAIQLMACGLDENTEYSGLEYSH